MLIVCQFSTIFQLFQLYIFSVYYPNVAGFFILKILCLGRSITLPYVWWKKMLQKWTRFVFSSTYPHQTFTECVSNWYTHFDVSICQIWLQVMKRPLIYCIFSYIIDEHPCLKCCTFTKLAQIVCLFNIHILPNLTAGYGWFFDLVEFFFWKFPYTYYYMFEIL